MDIKSIYHDYLVHLESKRERTKNKFHASSAGSCLRKQMYSYYDFPQDIKDDKSYRVLRLGTVMHEEIENSIMHYAEKGHGGRIYIETPVEIEELNLVGTYDVGELITKDNKTTFNLYDIKTTAAYSWQKMFGQIKNRVAGSDNNYKMQLATYALAINNEHNPDKLNIYLFWYNKNTQMVRETLVSPEWIDKALEYWVELNSILDDSGKMFEQDLTPEVYPGVPFKNWECSYCSYYSICPSTLRERKRK